MYLLELLLDVNKVEFDETERLHKEANEILAIVVASIKTMRNRKS